MTAEDFMTPEVLKASRLLSEIRRVKACAWNALISPESLIRSFKNTAIIRSEYVKLKQAERELSAYLLELVK